MKMCAVNNKCEGICKEIHEKKERKCPAFYFQQEENIIKKNIMMSVKKVDFLDL